MELVTFSRSDVNDIADHLAAVASRVPLRPIRNETDYASAINALNNLLDVGAGRERHRLAPLVDLLGRFISDYEEARYPNAETSPSDMLRLLMTQHGLRQSDLPEIGSQGVVSEVLNGKRELNTGQIKRLCQRFGVSPSTFF